MTSFDPICLLVESPAVFVVNSASPYRKFSEVIDAARAKPGELSMGSVGPGSTFQFSFLSFTRAEKVSMTYVPFSGSAAAVTAVLGQHVTSAFSGLAVVSEHVKADKLRALAVGTAKRIGGMPDVPTLDESGYKGVEVDSWFGIVTPAGTPKETLAQLSGWFRAALQAPEVKAKLAMQELYPVGTCGDEYGALIRKSYDEYGRMISEAGLKKE